jgi:hypothetical protein
MAHLTVQFGAGFDKNSPMKHYLGICLVLLTMAGIVLFTIHSCTMAADHTIDSVRDAFVQVLRVQPQIMVNQRVVLTQTAPIAELAVVTKEEFITLGFTEHLEVFTVQLPLTEKKLVAEGTYQIKAGFDLSEPFSVEIDPLTHDIIAAMPHAKILSVEQVGDLVFDGEDAILNRVTDAERQQIVNNLNAAARDAAEKSSLKSDAEEQVKQRLKDLIRHNGQPIDIEWKNWSPARGDG